MKSQYTAIVVGAGPAGIFASRELARAGVTTLLVEKGQPVSLRNCPMSSACYHCASCHQIEGVGGAGGYSDGKLCYGPVGIAPEMLGARYATEVGYVRAILSDVAGTESASSGDIMLSRRDAQVTEEITDVVFLGSTRARYAFHLLHQRLPVDKLSGQTVASVDRLGGEFVVRLKNGARLTSRYVVVATGKGDFALRSTLVRGFALKLLPHYPALGVRLEVPNEHIAGLRARGVNPKIKKHYNDGEYVKTHCLCHGGEVIAYACGPYMLVGGRSDRYAGTAFGNVNLLYQSHTARTADLVTRALKHISDRLPDNVLCQDISSFAGERRHPIRGPTPCRGAMIGDLASLYPNELLGALRDFIATLVEHYGLDISMGLAHGPAAEWIKPPIQVSLNGESSAPDLFFVGDNSGATQGIVAAAVTGVRAGQEIARRESACEWPPVSELEHYAIPQLA